MALWSAVRPHQWVKNLLVALPAVALHRYDPIPILAAFVSFCLASSSVYLVNDVIDLKRDRKHPSKKRRAVASGRLPFQFAWIIAILLFWASIGVAAMLDGWFIVPLGIYFLLSWSYSLYLKRIMMLDVIVLAMLYGIRVVAGAEASMIALSHWLIAFCFFLFLCLALVKRTADSSGRPYTDDDGQLLISLATASGFTAVVTLVLYINDLPLLYDHPNALWGICLVLVYWLGRVFLVTIRGEMHDDPVVFALTDKASWVCAVLAAAIFWAAI